MYPDPPRHLPEDPADRQMPEYLDFVGPGWHGILMRTHAELLAVLPHYQLSQVKEKWGVLRIHLAPHLDPITGELGITRELGGRIHAIVHAAEEESRRTCETCGEPGSATGSGWITTLCPEHARCR